MIENLKQKIWKEIFEPDTMEYICRHCKYSVHVKADEEDLEAVTCTGPSGEHHPEQEMVKNG